MTDDSRTSQAALPSTTKIVITFLLSAVVFGGALWCASSANQTTTDRGVVSAFAVASLTEQRSVVGDLSLIGVTPERPDDGRIGVWMAMGAPGEEDAIPAEGISSRLGTGDDSATADDRQGITLVVGGAAAGDFAHCEPSVEVSIFEDVSYSELSSVEKAAVVQSVATQMIDRQAQYGDPPSSLQEEAIDIAGEMTFTIIEPTTLSQYLWPMTGAAPSPETLPDSDSEPISEAVESNAVGYGSYFLCDVSFASLWSTQSWGVRFEIPALAVASAPSVEITHTVARFGLSRETEYSAFGYSSREGLDGAEVEESWAGMYSERASAYEYSTTDPVVVMPDVAIRFGSLQSTSYRDVSLFLAGVLLSLFASLLVAGIKQIRSRAQPATTSTSSH